MTAHIDVDNLETDKQDCDTHDLHEMQKQLVKVNHSKRGWIFLFAVSVFFNLIFIVSRIYNG